MRVPEISLVNELQAQNKHDLYRYHKYKREYQQTQYLTACTVSFMVVPSVRAWGFSIKNLNSLPIRYIINRKGKSQATSPKSN